MAISLKKAEQKSLKKLILNSGNWKTEEEVRKSFLKELENLLDIEFNAERDRNDAHYNQVIIEFKNKGFFKGSTTSSSFKEAIDKRLLPYILRRAKSERIDPGEYIGIAIDGCHIAFSHIEGDEILHGPLMELSSSSFKMLLDAVKNSRRRAFTCENLIEDFGHSSSEGVELLSALSESIGKSLNSKDNNKIKMLFEEWKTLFGQASGLSAVQIKSIEKTINFKVYIKGKNKIPALLFTIHTYNSLIIKFLAAEVIAEHGLTSFKNFAGFVAQLEHEDIKSYLKEEIEGSKFFEAAGIKGFVEEAVFSWYLDSDDLNPILSAIRSILIKMSLFRLDSISYESTGDILKRFYQDLVPDVLRKSLGEFYTPDWMIKYFYDRLGKTTDLRILDPTCGSGSFLMEAILRRKKYGEKKGENPKETLSAILENIWGFDLNPLAVQTARVNYLIAISDILKEVPGTKLEVPVLMADAVYSPAKDPESDSGIVEYTIGSEIADLVVTLPVEIAFDRQWLDRIFETMGLEIEDDREFEEVEKKLLQLNILKLNEAELYREPLKQTYNRVLDLHRRQWNGIWFRIVRNFFWSATAGKFDLVVGNPPWVRWSNLPPAYRERIKPTCENYEIFSSTPFHGGNELDISGMITYTVADKWLKDGATIGFVLTQSHFQAPSSEGFRTFNINETDKLSPVWVEDLKALKPFPDAANKTSLAVFKKTKEPKIKYPVKYFLWTAKPGFTKTLPEKSSVSEILNRVKIDQWEATPVGDIGSPWAVLPEGRFDSLRAISSPSTWCSGRKGITADLNGVYFVNIIQENSEDGLVQIETRPEAGKNDIGPKRRFWVEASSLYPLAKGSGDFKAYDFNPKKELFTFLPNLGITKTKYEEAVNVLNNDSPLTMTFFETYRSLLENRSTFRTRMPGAPFFAVYNVGDYTLAPFKVIWAEQSGAFKSCVVSSKNVPLFGERCIIPDHKIFFVDCYVELEAYYLSAMLNNKMVAEFLYSHNISIQVGNIFKHLNLPEFDSENKQHIKLAEEAKLAHELKGDEKEVKILECELLSSKVF